MNFIKKKDFLVVAVLLLISCIGLLVFTNIYGKSNKKAEIYYESELIMTIDLNEKVDKTIVLPQNENVIFHQHEDGSIGFEASDCPDKVCINSGKLSHVGSSAACLPNKVILKIVPIDSSKESDTDLIIN